tara:strand:+ start:306 stop:569 length:264 start_codon:yes stop_codon:yes gene_type:complete
MKNLNHQSAIDLIIKLQKQNRRLENRIYKYEYCHCWYSEEKKEWFTENCFYDSPSKPKNYYADEDRRKIQKNEGKMELLEDLLEGLE